MLRQATNYTITPSGGPVRCGADSVAHRLGNLTDVVTLVVLSLAGQSPNRGSFFPAPDHQRRPDTAPPYPMVSAGGGVALGSAKSELLPFFATPMAFHK